MPSANIVTDYSAVADVKDFTSSVTISSGTPTHVLISSGTFVSGDVGKGILIYGAQASGALSTTIASVTNATNIILTDAATAFPTTTTCRVIYGTDNSTAFMNFNAWAQSQVGLVTLTIPSNANPYWIGGFGGSTTTKKWALGVKQLQVNGTGATLQGGSYDSSGNLTPGFALGQIAPVPGNGQDGSGNPQQSKIASVPSGSTVVTLLDTSVISLCSAGQWVLIAGIDLQGGGSPCNNQFFEYVQIQSVSSPNITLATPLQNSYQSTWPLYDPGSKTQPCQGGPATLFPLNGFDLTSEFIGLTFKQDGQTSASGKSITLTNCTMKGSFGVIPSENKYFILNGCDYTGIGLEVDKLIENFSILNGSIFPNTIDFQSASVINFTVDSSTVNFIQGNAINCIINNSTISDLQMGAHSYGRSLTLQVNNSTINSLEANSVKTAISGSLNMVNGVIISPNISNPQPWAVPGGKLFWGGAKTTETSFTIQSITQDATNTYIQTNSPAGYPTVPITSQYSAQVHPCPSISVTNSTGCDDIVSLSQAPKAIPVYSWQRRTYGTVGNTGTVQSTFELWGFLKKVTIDVQTPYTGTAPNLFFHLSDFDNWPIVQLGNLSTTNWGPCVNAAIAGQRILTSSGWTGAQSGDVLSAFPTLGWFPTASNSGPQFQSGSSAGSSGVNFNGESSSKWPVIVLTMETDQGFPTTYGLLSLRK